MATRGGAASSSSSTGGGMKRVPTWLTVSNLKLDADLKRRHDAETSIEWEWHLDPDFECGLTHLDLEHLRDVAVRKGMGDDETRRIAWPIVLGIGLEPGERRDAGEYVDRAAHIEAAISENRVAVFSKTTCGFCARAKACSKAPDSVA